VILASAGRAGDHRSGQRGISPTSLRGARARPYRSFCDAPASVDAVIARLPPSLCDLLVRGRVRTKPYKSDKAVLLISWPIEPHHRAGRVLVPRDPKPLQVLISEASANN